MLDSASRLPLAAKLFLKKPNAEDMLAFVERAFARLGKPRYLIVDQDGCFTATSFRERIDAWRVRLRFCSADHHRANAKLERFWAHSRTPCFDSTRPSSCSPRRNSRL